MITGAFIFILLITLLFIVILQNNYNMLKKKHLEKMRQLQATMKILRESQNNLAKKNHLINTFNNEYKNSKELINQEVLGLIYDFLKKQQ